MKLSNAVVLSGNTGSGTLESRLGDNQIILLGTKVVLIHIAAAWSASWLTMIHFELHSPFKFN